MAALLWLLIAGLYFFGSTEAKVVTYQVNVTWSDDEVTDGVTKPVIVQNDLYPGPLISCTEGDRLLIYVYNGLFLDGLTIHWHGIKQIGTPAMDGVAGTSQCPTIPGQYFLYNFTTSGQFGTFWYHSHAGVQKSAGLYGPLIVYPPASIDEKTILGYDAELEPILVNDWYHADLTTELFDAEAGPPPNPATLLINGIGTYNCSADRASAATKTYTTLDGRDCNATYASSLDAYPVFEVEKGKKYRIRLIGASTLVMIAFQIQGHNFTVVEADANYVNPVVLSDLDINTGQTYSVILNANQPVGNYWIHIRSRFRTPDPNPFTGGTEGASSWYLDPITGEDTAPTKGEPIPLFAAAILRYKGANATFPTTSIPQTPPAAWDDTEYSLTQQRKFVARASHNPAVPAADREILLVAKQEARNGITGWALNGYVYQVPRTPFLLQRYYNLGAFHDTGYYDKPNATLYTWDYSNSSATPPTTTLFPQKLALNYNVRFGSTVQIVFQNTYAGPNSDQHPFHLHGHDFWVLGWGDGNYNSTSKATFNLKNPPRRNTVTLYPGGWVAIRYTADNPGLWPMHCHILFHLAEGMQVNFAEGLSQLPDLPVNYPTCGSINNAMIGRGAYSFSKKKFVAPYSAMPSSTMRANGVV